MGTGRKRIERMEEEEEEEKEEEGIWQKRKRWNAVTRFSAGAVVDLPALLLDHAVWGMGLGDFPFRSKCHDSFCLTNNLMSL